MKKNRDYTSSCRSPYRGDYREKNMEVYEKMKEELDAYNEQGVLLSLSGKQASSARIADVCCIRESGSYMGDYILDDDGKLVEICFDKVRKY